METALQVGVKALIKNSQGKYLLLKRNKSKYPNNDGNWDIVGGRIEPGINLLENLQREIYEETNLSIVGNPKLIAAQDILRVPGKHIVRLTYIAKAKGNLKLDSSENEEFVWVTLDEMKKYADLDKYVKDLFRDKIL